MICIITFFVAFASILYEMILSQFAIAILGGTIFQHIITTSIYISFLGFGSILYSKNQYFQNNKNFELIELLLITLSMLSIPLILNLVNYDFINVIIYIIVGLIGFLSGIELPMLMDLYLKKHNNFSQLILSVDFLGTFFGIIFFIFYLIPYENLLFHIYLISFINFIILILYKIFISKNFQNIIYYCIFCIIYSLIFYYKLELIKLYNMWYLQ